MSWLGWVVMLFTLIQWVVPVGALLAADYYVDGASGNDANPGTLKAPWKTVTKANTTLYPGDTVHLRSGTYQEKIQPSRSGEAGKYVSYRRFQDEVVTFTGRGNVYLSGKRYVNVDGLNFVNTNNVWVELNNSDHNIIQNCYMKGTAGTWVGISMYTQAHYNRIVNNTLIGGMGSPETCFPKDVINIDGGTHNLIAGNTISYAPHVLIAFRCRGTEPTSYNIIKDNTIHNPWHTGISINYNADNTLIEGNTITDCGDQRENNSCGTDRDRSMERFKHKGIQLASSKCIIRNNVLVNNGSFTLNSDSEKNMSVSNRIYNNTFYKNYKGIYTNSIYSMYDNVLKNNIFYSHYENEVYHNISMIPKYNYYINNNLYGAPSRYFVSGPLDFIASTYPAEWVKNTDVEPQFVNAHGRDLRLAPTSPMIDKGAWLTTISSAGGSGKSFTVADTGYFSDGFGMIEGDEIQVQGKTARAKIVAVDPASQTITVDTVLTWQQGDGVALAYEGKAPDLGARESMTALPPPVGLKILQ